MYFYVNHYLYDGATTRTVTIRALAEDPDIVNVVRNFSLPVTIDRQSPWASVPMSHLVSWWLHYPKHNLGIEIKCADCPAVQTTNLSDKRKINEDLGDQRRPYLAIDIAKRSSLRRRRHAEEECTGYSCCQQRELYIDFAAIGWTFIQIPRGYWTNFCFGRCSGERQTCICYLRYTNCLMNSWIFLTKLLETIQLCQYYSGCLPPNCRLDIKS